LLLILAIVVVAGVVGFIVFRENPKDVPRLVVLRQEQVTKGYEVPFFVVVFRFDAPKHTGARLQQVITRNPSTGEERRLVGVGLGGGRTRYKVWDQPTLPPGAVINHPQLEVEAGQSTEFSVVRPVDDVWRLRCQFARDYTGIRSLPTRVRQCWIQKSFAPLLWKFSLPSEIMESDFITNTVPPTADAARP
jgi:hypothetical protein